MMNVQSFTQSTNFKTQFSANAPQEITAKEAHAKGVFQDFVAGTFYKQMLSALRSTQGETPYLDGGQAEKIFRSQMDQQIAEDLAKTHGEVFSNSLYESFSAHLDKSV